jgi:tetratricopeptide (TPR) repeat protein
MGSNFPRSGGDVRTLLQHGLAAQRAGQLAPAEQAFRAALKVDRNYAEAHGYLAAVLTAQRRFADALEAVKRAIALDERNPAHHVTKGNLHFAQQQFAAARTAFEKAQKLAPRDASIAFNVGVAAEKLADSVAACAAYERAIELDPRAARAMHNLAMLHLAALRFADAERVLARALEVAPGLAELWNAAGNLARAQNDAQRAVECYEKAIAIAPRLAGLRLNLGQVLREAGRPDEAVRAYESALQVDPNFSAARIPLCITKHFDAPDDSVRWLEEMAKDPARAGIPEDELFFAVSKVRGELGDDEGSFQALVRGNAARRRTIRWSIDEARARFEAQKRRFDRATIERLRGRGDPDATMIFVLGMPRSNTSLTEQILASHPRVFGAGELVEMETAVRAHPALSDPELPLDEATLRAAAAAYLAAVRPLGAGRERIVDKCPGNFVHLGAIATMLPNAKVVHCIREARDNCWSIFRQSFAGDQPFAYDLRELGAYYRLYEDLMAHWRDVLGPAAFLDLHYEALLDDFEPQVRRLLEFVGLEWDARCLEFHRTERIVRTASMLQVKQPLFRSSLAAWRRHEGALAPLFEALGPR